MSQFYASINKVDSDNRLVYGIASTEALDNQGGEWNGVEYVGDIVAQDAIKGALPDYMQYANIREMHTKKAAGNAFFAEVIKGQLHLAVAVEDDDAWRKVKKKVYKGFSIGGSILDAVIKNINGKPVRIIKKLILNEISLVDRPANPEATFIFYKGENMPPEVELQQPAQPVPTLVELAESITKAADPSKAISTIQQLRNDSELSGDSEGAQLYTQAIALLMQASGQSSPSEQPEEPEVTEEPEAEAASEVEYSAKANVQKAGKAISKQRMDAMQAVVKSMLEMLSTGGHPSAQKALAAFGGEPEQAPVVDAEKFASTTSNAIEKALKPQFDALSTIVQAFDQRLQTIEKMASPRGPVVRDVNKMLATGSNSPAPDEASVIQKMLDEEPNPLIATQLRERLAEVQLKKLYQ